MLPAPHEAPSLPLSGGAEPKPHRLGVAGPDDRTLDAGAVLVLLVGLVGCALASGCASQPADVELLELTALGPDVVEAGRRIVVDGAGLPEGEGATLVLDGTLHGPSGEHTVRLALDAEIVSAERAEALVTGAFLETLGDGGRGTFRGRAELRVPMADGAGVVAGRLDPVVVDLRPSALLELEADVEDTGEDIDPLLGLVAHIEPEPDPTARRRTVIDAVIAEGRAADLGARPGDELLAIEGMRIAAEGDLTGWGRRIGALTVRRDGHELPLSSHDAVVAAPSDRVRVLQAAALLVALLILLRERDRSASRARVPLGAIKRGAPALIFVAVALGVVHVAVGRLHVERLAEILAPVALVLALSGAAAGGAGALLSIGRVVILALGIVSALVTAGAADLAELWDAQAMAPTGWALLRSPIAPALAVLFAGALPPTPSPSAHPALRWVTVAVAAVVIATVVLCTCGGPGQTGAWGTLLFVARGVIVTIVLVALATALERASFRARALTLLGAAALTIVHGAATLWVGELDGSASLAQASAEVWLAVIGLGALVALRRPPTPRLELELAL